MTFPVVVFDGQKYVEVPDAIALNVVNKRRARSGLSPHSEEA